MATSFVSLIMALIMAVSGIGSITTGLEAPVGVEAAFTVNEAEVPALADLFVAMSGAADEETAAQMQSTIGFLTRLVDGVGFRGAVAPGAIELEVKKGDAQIAFLSGATNEEGAALATSLLPGYVFTAKNETIQQFIEQMMAMFMPAAGEAGEAGEAAAALAIPEIDMEKLSEELAAIMGNVTNDLNNHLGEPESGEFEVDSYKFTLKVPITYTTKELALLGYSVMKDFLAMESLQPILAMDAVKNLNLPGQMEEMFAQVEAQDEAELPVLDSAMYSNEADDSYVTFDLTKDEQTMVIHVGTVEGGVVYRYEIPDMMSMDMGFSADGSMVMEFHMNAEGVPVDVFVLGTFGESGYSYSSVVNVMGLSYTIRNTCETLETGVTHMVEDLLIGEAEEPVATFECAVGIPGEISAAPEDATELAMEDLLAGGEEAEEQVQGAFFGGLISTVSSFAATLSEEDAAMLSAMMSGGGAEAVEEVPAE